MTTLELTVRVTATLYIIVWPILAYVALLVFGPAAMLLFHAWMVVACVVIATGFVWFILGFIWG